MCGKVATVATWAAFGGLILLLSVNYGQNPAPGQSLFLREPLRQTYLPANLKEGDPFRRILRIWHHIPVFSVLEPTY